MNRLEGKKVDRLPNMNLVMMFAAKQTGVSFGQYVSDYHYLVEGALRCYEKFGFDIVCAISDPMREAEGFGADVIIPEEGVPYCREKRIKTLDDIATLKVIDPSCGRRMNDRLEAVRLLKQKVGKDVPVVGWIEGALAESCDLMGVQEFFIALMEEPEEVKPLLDISMEQCLRFAEAQISAGADIIGMGDAVSSLIGPSLYEEYALPYQKEMIRRIHEMGAKVKLHICGDLNPVLEYTGQTGADIIDLDYMVDMDRAAEIFPENCSICGNMDPVSVVYKGSLQTIREEVRRCIRLREKNHNIIAAGCEIPKDTPEENVMEIYRTISEEREEQDEDKQRKA